MHSGTPAARMKKVPSTVVKKRSRELTYVFESFAPYQGMEGQIERIWITEIATDGVHLVRQSSYVSFPVSCLLGVKNANLSHFKKKKERQLVWQPNPDGFS